MKPVKVAVYARVSTFDQKPENQVQELRKYAKRRGFKIVHEYIDYASGAKESRPAIDQLMRDARAGAFDVVLVWKLDRLGRSLQHLIQVIAELKKLGIDFITSTQEIDTTTASGRLVFHIFGAIAEFERELIRERIFIGIARAKHEGKHTGRPKGSLDKKPRRTSGYLLRWSGGKKSSPPKSGVSSWEGRP